MFFFIEGFPYIPFITCLNDVSCPSQVVLVTYCRVCAGRGHNYTGLLCWQQHVSRYQQPAAVSPGGTIHLPSELCVSIPVPVTAAVWPGPGPGWFLTGFYPPICLLQSVHAATETHSGQTDHCGLVPQIDPSVPQSVFTITDKAPTRAFSWLKAPTSAFTFKTLLRHYAKRALTPR